jgi:hypothetical protein
VFGGQEEGLDLPPLVVFAEQGRRIQPELGPPDALPLLFAATEGQEHHCTGFQLLYLVIVRKTPAVDKQTVSQ